MDNSWIGNYSYARARLNAEGVAVVDLDTDKRYTYGDLDRRANTLANILRDQYGISKGDRVAYISRSRVELIDGYFATGKLGAILVPYNARLSAEELTQLMTNEQPKVLIYEGINAATAQKLAENGVMQQFICLDADPNPLGHAVYDELLAGASAAAVSCPELQLEDVHLIIHTGGTTGLPKGGLITHKGEIFNAFSEICTWGLRYDDKALILLPLFHTGGWNLLTLPLLHVGGTIYLARAYDPKKTIETVEKEKITYLFGAATIFRMMVERPEFQTADLSSLKWLMAGAAPTPLNIMQQFWDKGLKFVLGYGMTEAGPNNLSTPPQFVPQEVIEEKYASVGKPFYLSMPKLIDDDGNEVTTPIRPASCSGPVPRSSTATGATRPRPRTHSSTAGSTPATWLPSIRTASTISLAARRTCSSPAARMSSPLRSRAPFMRSRRSARFASSVSPTRSGARWARLLSPSSPA